MHELMCKPIWLGHMADLFPFHLLPKDCALAGQSSYMTGICPHSQAAPVCTDLI